MKNLVELIKPDNFVFVEYITFALLIIGLLFLIFERFWPGDRKPVENFFGGKTPQIAIIILLILLLLHTFGYFHQKAEPLGIPDTVLHSLSSGLILLFLTLLFLDNLRKSYEKRDRETNLTNSVDFIEKLYKDGFHESTLRISENLFKDIFENIHAKNQLSSAFIGDLEVYGNSLLAGTDFTNELSNLMRVERLYEEIFNVIIQNTQECKHHTFKNYLYEAINFKPLNGNKATKECPPNISYKSDKYKFLLNKIILYNKKDQKQTVLNFLRYTRFFNTWADILISLSSYVNKDRNLNIAELVLSYGQQLFIIADIAHDDGITINDCIDFSLQKIKYMRLCAEHLHEKSRIESSDPNEYKKTTDNIKEKCEEGLMVFFSDTNNILIPQLDIWKPSHIDLGKHESLVELLQEKVLANKHYYGEENIRRYNGPHKEIRKICKDSNISDYINKEENENRFMDDLFVELREIYKCIALNNIRGINRFSDTDTTTCIKCEEDIIKLAFSRMRALLKFEISWKHSISLYDNIGMYYTEKGRYEGSLNKDNAALFFKIAIHFHKMTNDYIINPSSLHPSTDNSNVADSDQPVKKYEANSIHYIRNLINLGRAYQCLYCKSNSSEKNEENFKQAEQILTLALKLVTQTDNFIYRARTHEYLGELYKEKPKCSDIALVSFRASLSVFFKNKYKTYHERTINSLADLYANIFKTFESKSAIDQQTRIFFKKLMNICTNFDDKNICPILKQNGPDNTSKSFREIFSRFPDDCPRMNSCHFWNN